MERPEPSCKRGRPREFDVDAALDVALAVFWRHGYEGASLSDLTRAMRINRPSLYAAFGNKEQLFRRALDRYAERATADLAEALSAPTARAAVERLLRGTVDRMTAGGACGGGGGTGCFLVVAALTGGPASQPLRDEMAALRRTSTPLLRARFDRAVAAGELPPDVDADALATYVATVLQGLSVQAASGVGRDALRAVVDVALRAWPAEPPAGRRRV